MIFAYLSFNENLLEFFFESPRPSFLGRATDYPCGLKETKRGIRVRYWLLKIENRSWVCWSSWRLTRIDRSRCRLQGDWIRRNRWFLEEFWCLLWRVRGEIARNRSNAILNNYRIELRGLLWLLLLKLLLHIIGSISKLLSIVLLTLNCLLLLWLSLYIIAIVSYWALHFLVSYSSLLSYWLLLL